jgi:hypothetical protein
MMVHGPPYGIVTAITFCMFAASERAPIWGVATVKVLSASAKNLLAAVLINTVASARVIKHLDSDEIADINAGHCLDCGNRGFILGPRGGNSLHAPDRAPRQDTMTGCAAPCNDAPCRARLSPPRRPPR